MDLPVVGKNRYDTWDDLYLYCYRVASTVGLMTLPVMGTSPGYTFDEATPPAVALGIALQITNILRDVGEDYRDRGRIYLPLEDMARFGVTEVCPQSKAVSSVQQPRMACWCELHSDEHDCKIPIRGTASARAARVRLGLVLVSSCEFILLGPIASANHLAIFFSATNRRPDCGQQLHQPDEVRNQPRTGVLQAGMHFCTHEFTPCIC